MAYGMRVRGLDTSSPSTGRVDVKSKQERMGPGGEVGVERGASKWGLGSGGGESAACQGTKAPQGVPSCAQACAVQPVGCAVQPAGYANVYPQLVENARDTSESFKPLANPQAVPHPLPHFPLTHSPLLLLV